MGVTEKQLKRYSARVRRQRRLRRLTLAALALLAVFLLVDRNFRPLVFSLAEARSAAMATRALNAALTEALEDGVDYDDLMNVRMDDGGQVSLLSANTMRMNALAERAGDAALRKLETVSAQKVDVPLGAALAAALSLLLALTLLVSVSALPVTAHAGGSKDTTPPTLTASLEGDALKIESSDDLSGVEAVFVDENRINSLTDGKASVALKDYAGTEKQVSIYAKDYAGNRSDAVKLDNPYYKEPAPEKKPAAAAPQSPSGTQTKPPKEEKPSGSNVATPSGGGNSSGSDNSTGQQENTSAVPEGAFTPEGTGTVQDNISGTDGEKQFYTITTDAGNVFYLVIDGKREDNNVYFLNGVTESDLMALAEKNNGSMSMIPQEESCSCTEKCEAGKVNTGCPVCKNDLNGCKGKEKPAETEKPAEPEKPKKETGSVGTILFILAALLAVGGIGYYVKIVRPKQQAEDDAEFEDDGYGEGFDPDEAYGEPEYLSEDDFDDKDSK
mgnify:CR=1 FL=1